MPRPKCPRRNLTDANAEFEIVRQSPGYPVSPQAPLVPDHVQDRLGVGSLLLLVGLGEGFRSGQNETTCNPGARHHIHVPRPDSAVEGSTLSGRTYHFTYQDYLAIRRDARSLKYLRPS
jgi:hypothetical protein